MSIHAGRPNRFPVLVAFLASLILASVAGGDVRADSAGKGGVSSSKASSGAPADRVVREGVVIEYSIEPVRRKGEQAHPLMEGEFADLKFRLTDEAKGQPLRRLWPGGWMDISQGLGEKGKPAISCREKVGVYLKELVGIRPLIDLTGYFLMTLNREPNISVIDPLVGIAGRTNLYATVPLEKPGEDWAKTADEKRLFVSMPQAGKVAAVDTDSFRLVRNVEAGENPVRVALQPDEGLLWVGNDAKYEKEGGVTVIRTADLSVVSFIPTGKGHHELAFSPDSRYAYVSNRSDGTVSVIDVQSRKKLRDVRIGPQPISLDYSRLSRSLYVTDGKEGTVSVVDGDSHEVVATIRAKPGLGPVRFTPDGRWGFVLNPEEDAVYVIDSSTNRIAHTLRVGDRPYQIALTRNFAHVRSLGTERVSMINIQELDKEARPPVNYYDVGVGAPQLATDLTVANSISAGVGEAEVLVVNPVNNNVYYYMEGMNAPMGSFQGYGKNPRAVGVINRGLKETAPGVYSSRVRIPAAGTYDVAFILDSPQIVHCFAATAQADPKKKKVRSAFEVEYLLRERKVKVGSEIPLRFRVLDPETRGPRAGLSGLSVLYYVSPGVKKTRVPAREVEQGLYEATLTIPLPGAYYVYAIPATAKVKFTDLRFITFIAVEEKPARPGGAGTRKE